jgi:cytochrome c556
MNRCILAMVTTAFLALSACSEKDADYDPEVARRADSVIKAIESTRDSLKKQRLEELKKEFVHNKDDFRDISFYHHKHWGNKIQHRNTLRCYVNSMGTAVLVTNYYADDWIFHESITALVGNKKHRTESLPSYHDNNHRDNAGGKVWETLTYFNEPLIRLIAENQDAEVKIRFNGDKYYSDSKLTKADVKAFKDCYELAYLLKK